MWKCCWELRLTAGKIWDLGTLCQIPYASHIVLFSDLLINLIPLQQQQKVVRYFLYLCTKVFPVLLSNKVRVFSLPWRKVTLLPPSIASSVDRWVKGYISLTSCYTTYQKSHSDQGMERWRSGRAQIRERKKKEKPKNMNKALSWKLSFLPAEH